MRSLRHVLLLALTPLWIGACGEPSPAAPPAALTWFAIGGDAHDLGDARATQSGVLDLGTTPRWFTGQPELISEAELARRRAAMGIVVEEARIEEGDTPAGMRWIAAPPPKPRRIEDLPTSIDGARLELSAESIEAGEEVRLTLTLHAGARALWRESEHRSTNVLPFLFTLTHDGEPIRIVTNEAAHQGGIQRFEQIVEAGASRRWTLRLRTASLEPHGEGELTITAAFCERQHTGWAALDGEHPARDTGVEIPFEGDPVLIRSESARVVVEP